MSKNKNKPQVKKPSEASELVFPLEQITPSRLSEILAKLEKNQFLEIHPDGHMIFKSRDDRGKVQATELRNRIFTDPGIQRVRSTGLVFPVEQPFNYSLKRGETRKAANRNEKIIQATATGFLMQIFLEELTPVIEKTDMSTYDRYTMENGTIVRTLVGDTDSVVMYRKQGEDWVYIS